MCCLIGNNKYLSQVQVMFRKIFGLNEINVAVMILTPIQKKNRIKFVSQELCQCKYSDIPSDSDCSRLFLSFRNQIVMFNDNYRFIE